LRSPCRGVEQTPSLQPRGGYGPGCAAICSAFSHIAHSRVRFFFDTSFCSAGHISNILLVFVFTPLCHFLLGVGHWHAPVPPPLRLSPGVNHLLSTFVSLSRGTEGGLDHVALIDPSSVEGSNVHGQAWLGTLGGQALWFWVYATELLTFLGRIRVSDLGFFPREYESNIIPKPKFPVI
jgi:hypothetical protein